MSRVKSAFWGSISSQLFMIMNMLLSIVITPLILKFLNKEEYGFYTILFQIVGYLMMLDFGLSGAIARSLASNRGNDSSSQNTINKIISTSFFTYSFFGLIIILIGVLLSPTIPHNFNMGPELSNVSVTITLTISIFIGLQFPLRVFSSIFYSHQRQALSHTINSSLSLLNSILPIVFLSLGKGLWSFVYTNIICSVAGILSTFILMRRFYPYLRIRIKFFDKPLLKELFSFGFYLFLNALAVQVVFFTDRFFIGSLVSLSAVSIYALTAKAPELCRELIFRITDNAYPAMVEITAKEGENKLKLIHQKLLLITVCCATIAFWMIFIVNRWFLKLWVGENFFAGHTVMILTLVLLLQHTILHVSAACLTGAGIVKGFSIISIFEAILNLALTLTLGKLLGVKGILLATIIAAGLTSIWFTPYTVLKHLKISLPEYLFKPLLIPFLSISSFGIVLYWMVINVFRNITLNWFNFIVLCLILVGLFSAFAWLFLLKKEFSNYIPHRFKKYLLLN